jgi:hypothetical protein
MNRTIDRTILIDLQPNAPNKSNEPNASVGKLSSETETAEYAYRFAEYEYKTKPITPWRDFQQPDKPNKPNKPNEPNGPMAQ